MAEPPEAESGKTFLHAWESARAFQLIHHTTGLRFFCAERFPTDDDPDPWDVFVIANFADEARVRYEAAAAGMTTDGYEEYLAQTAMELATKSAQKEGWTNIG